VRSARVGLALSIFLALSGSAAAAGRLVAGTSSTPVAVGAIRPYTCHDTIHLSHVADTAPAPAGPATMAAAPPTARVPTPATTTAPTNAVAAAATIAPRVDLPGTCNPTPEQIAAAQKLVDDTRATITNRYRSVSQATLDGFQMQTNDDSARTRVMHYISQTNQQDGRTPDPSAPEGLLYGRTDHHGVVLVGAFYVTGAGQAPPDVAGCLAPWHVHSPGAPAMLHVWIVNMPGGPFTGGVDPTYIASL